MTENVNKEEDANDNNNNNNSMDDKETIKNKEEVVQKKASSLPYFYRPWMNFYASILIFFRYLISLETIFGILLSVGLTCFLYIEKTKEEATTTMLWNGGSMDWVLLSFAVITPMSRSIAIVFTRREKALTHIAEVRATVLNIYNAHACWDWCKWGEDDTSGRSKLKNEIDWLEHADNVQNELIGLCDELYRFLLLPCASRGRHRMTQKGKVEAHNTMEVSILLFNSIIQRIGNLTLYCELFKKAGLPPNEATRIRQWERILLVHIEGLRNIKYYRSPQALRSFVRLFSLFLPPFYSPYYAQLAMDLESLPVGIIFAILTPLALTALFDSVSKMEDPFIGYLTLDGIDIQTELKIQPLQHFNIMRQVIFKDAKPLTIQSTTTPST